MNAEVFPARPATKHDRSERRVHVLLKALTLAAVLAAAAQSSGLAGDHSRTAVLTDTSRAEASNPATQYGDPYPWAVYWRHPSLGWQECGRYTYRWTADQAARDLHFDYGYPTRFEF